MSRGKILIVEDEKDISDILEEMLTLFGYTVSAIGNGLEAWRLVSQKEFDLVLTDLRLPGIDGIELLTKMRLHGIKSPVLIISGVDLQSRRAILNKLGPYDSIQKPFKMEDLNDRLTKLLKDARQNQPKTKRN